MKKILLSKKRGLSGISHILVATVIFQIIWLLPMFSSRVGEVKDRGLIGILLFWGIVLGASLISDLDNQVSTAGYQLGLLGKIMTMFSIMTSGVIYSSTKTDKDHCKSQHRMFWHTPFVTLLGFIIITFFIPESNVTIFEYIKSAIQNKTTSIEGLNGSSASIAIMFFILSCASFYLFVNILCYRGSKIIGRQFFNALKPILSWSAIIYLGVYMPISYLKFTGTAVCIGSLLHIIGDLFSLGSVPIFFPLKIKGQRWYKPKIPFQLETGGMANQILNFVLFIVSIGLFILIKKVS